MDEVNFKAFFFEDLVGLGWMFNFSKASFDVVLDLKILTALSNSKFTIFKLN